MNACPKLSVVRDRSWLDTLRTYPDLITGTYGNENESVVPAHIGTLGRGIKIGDDNALPLLDRWHKLGHQQGEMSMFRKHLPDHILRDALRALAREWYLAHMKRNENE